MNIYIPYTYLVGWSTLDRWYYGVRFRPGCNPDDLWIKYFTSSKRVKLFREIHGEPDVVQVRQTFETAEEALVWEEKVLKRLKVLKDDRWLNMAYTSGKFHTKDKVFITDGNQQVMVNKDMPIPDGWRLGKSDKSRENYKAGAAKRSWYFPDSARKNSEEKRKNSIVITDDVVNIYHPKDEPIPEGFRKGLSKDICEKRSLQHMGIRHSEDRKQNIGNGKRGYKFINNGTVEIQIKDSTLPDGFVWGRLPRTEEHNKNAREARQGVRWYTDGVKNIQCKPENAPEGFVFGRTVYYKQSKESIEKRSAAARGKKWYTDGTTNIKSFECPVGFRPGVVHKKSRLDTL